MKKRFTFDLDLTQNDAQGGDPTQTEVLDKTNPVWDDTGNAETETDGRVKRKKTARKGGQHSFTVGLG
ncbi:hypothetical protein SESBI_38451 [Sesbania bispinosa]|nr:hypothetical protein SESBI_38451 [Sesbania bispinosa]